jgi:hypothetical protein
VDFSSPRTSPPATNDFRRDTELLGAVCGEYLTHADTGWRSAVEKHPDRESLAAAADQHGVLPLFARSLSRAGISYEIAQSRAREIAFRNLSLAAELVRVIGALRNIGVQALAYKGPILGQQLYGDVALRQFRDLDILIAPADVLRTRDALYQLGYQETERSSSTLLRSHIVSQCEWQMRAMHSGTAIELHWALFPRYFSFHLPVTELDQAGVTIEIAGERVRTLDILHLALVLSVHGTKHFWSRLGWLVDFAIVLRDYAVIDAEKLLNEASRRGIKRVLLISAALANRILRLELPEAFQNAISADPNSRVLADQMTRILGGAEMASEDLLTETILLVRSRERWSDRAKIVSRLAFTPGPQEWRSIALPGWAKCLYLPLRVSRAARYLPRIARRMFPRRKPGPNT